MENTNFDSFINKSKLYLKILLLSLIIFIFVISIILNYCKHDLVLGLIFLLFGLHIFNIMSYFSLLKKCKQIKKYFTINNIINELKNISFNVAGNYILTDNYIIDLTSKNFIIKYTDIILIYKKHVFKRYSIDTVLNIVTINNKNHKFAIDTDCNTINLEYKDFSDIILSKNKNVLVGKTKENKKIVKEKYGIELDRKNYSPFQILLKITPKIFKILIFIFVGCLFFKLYNFIIT